MLVRRRPASLNLSSRINLRIVRTLTTTISIATIMARREGILIVSRPTMTKEHEKIIEVIGRVM